MTKLSYSQGYIPSKFILQDGTMKVKSLCFMNEVSLEGIETIPIGVDEFDLYYRNVDWICITVLDCIPNEVMKAKKAYILGRIPSSKVPTYSISDVDNQDWYEVPLSELIPMPS